jgi:hypothetical protein
MDGSDGTCKDTEDTTLVQMEELECVIRALTFVKKHKKNMNINKVVVMYLDTGEIVRPSAPPDVSAVKGILLSYSFLFFCTPGQETSET